MLQELAPCTCGLLYGSCGGCGRGCVGGASAFSVLLPMAGGRYRRCGDEEGGGGAYGGGSVDCTLSLGTPSTRRAEAGAHGPVGLASFWDAVSGCGGGNGKQQESSGACREANVVAGGGGVLVRRCANCDRTSTPLWRNGPRGPKSLCNACGIRYKKEERRAAAAAPPTSDSGVGYTYGYARQQQQQPQWGCYGPAAAKTAASFAILGDVDAADKVGPCLSWRLGVMPSSPAFAVQERHSLFQYY